MQRCLGAGDPRLSLLFSTNLAVGFGAPALKLAWSIC
jgi:hypothetical protein